MEKPKRRPNRRKGELRWTYQIFISGVGGCPVYESIDESIDESIENTIKLDN